MSGKTKLFFIAILLMFGAQTADAASLYIDPAFSTLYRGDAIKMAVRLDVDEDTSECVNAVDGVITYTDNIEPVDISLGDSIFSVWVEAPVINKENRTITFAGGLPNGYCGRVQGDPRLTNTIVELVFRSPGFSVGSSNDSGVAEISFMSETTAYLNDGLGTKADLNAYGSKITLEKSAGGNLQDPWTDEVNQDLMPPQEFSISLEKGNREFNGKYYIVFNTTDKETGIDHYEVMEESTTELGSFMWGRADAPWVKARSPYVLEDQTLNSVIRVRAIDKAGNEYIATLIPGEDQRGIPLGYFVYGAGGIIMILLLLAMAFTGYKAFRKRRQNMPISEDMEDDDGDELEADEENEYDTK